MAKRKRYCLKFKKGVKGKRTKHAKCAKYKYNKPRKAAKKTPKKAGVKWAAGRSYCMKFKKGKNGKRGKCATKSTWNGGFGPLRGGLGINSGGGIIDSAMPGLIPLLVGGAKEAIVSKAENWDTPLAIREAPPLPVRQYLFRPKLPARQYYPTPAPPPFLPGLFKSEM